MTVQRFCLKLFVVMSAAVEGVTPVDRCVVAGIGRDGVPGLSALRSPGLGHQELLGGGQAQGQDRGFRHVT